jgi:hypothetical protein
MRRRFLVYCPVGGPGWKPDLFGADRKFDVALNSYRGTALDSPAEYAFQERTQKLLGVHRNLTRIERSYDAYAFLDDDIEVGTGDLNRLFEYGIAQRFQLWQPALTSDSYFSHKWTRQARLQGFRYRREVEMMAPFFSAAALQKCSESFGDGLSGWGIDMEAWPALLGKGGTAVVDGLPVRHARPVQARATRLAHGLHPRQEWDFMVCKYGRPARRLAYRLELRWRWGLSGFSCRKLPHLQLFVLPGDETSSVWISDRDNWACIPPRPGATRLQVVVQALRENAGRIVLFAQSGFRFRRPAGLAVFTAIEGRDMVFSPGKPGAPLDLSFMALRGTPEVVELWEGLLPLETRTRSLASEIAERVNAFDPSKIRWGWFTAGLSAS